MKKFRSKIFVVLVLLLIGIAGIFSFPNSLFQNLNSSFSNSAETQDSEEYAVYSTLLNEMFVKDNAKLLVISDQTLFYNNSLYPKRATFQERVEHKKKYYSAVPEEVIKNFEIEYEQSSQIHSKFNLPIKYVLIREIELSEKVLRTETEAEDDRENERYFLYDKYPDAAGLIRISKIGFNGKKTQAFVEIELTHCGLCGGGNYVFLEKEEGIWKVRETYQTWIF